MIYDSINLNKLLIICFVGVCAITSLFLNMENVCSVCIGGLVGYLSKDITLSELTSTNDTDAQNSTLQNKELEDNEIITIDDNGDDDIVDVVTETGKNIDEVTYENNIDDDLIE